MCGSIMLVCASILHISYPWLTDSLSTNSLENIIRSIIAQITWRRKSRCFIFQSRMCFEKILQIKPGKENLIKGRSLFLFLWYTWFICDDSLFFKDQPISLILTCHLLIHPHIISFFIDQNVSDPPLFTLHCPRTPEPGRFGGKTGSRAECSAGVVQRGCRSHEDPSAAGQAVSAWPGAFLLLWRICNSGWSHYKQWVSFCVCWTALTPPHPRFTVPSMTFMPFTRINS